MAKSKSLKIGKYQTLLEPPGEMSDDNIISGLSHLAAGVLGERRQQHNATIRVKLEVIAKNIEKQMERYADLSERPAFKQCRIQRRSKNVD